MELLVSVINLEEAKEAIKAKADILDIKNPKEGSLGANFPWIIKQISDYSKDMIISTTVGDVPYKPGTVSLASLGCAVSGSNYVKVGLYGTKNFKQAKDVMDAVVKVVKEYDQNITVVACGYADSYNIDSVSSNLIPKIAYESGCDVAMLDTYVKDGRRLTDYLDRIQLENFVETSHNYNLKVALAGSVNKDDMPLLKSLSCDIVGVRGCVCSDGDRNNGVVSSQLIQELKDNI